MTTNQSQAIWELCRQGLPLEAEEAAKTWTQGQHFELADGIHLTRFLVALIRQCNWEVERSEPPVHMHGYVPRQAPRQPLI